MRVKLIHSVLFICAFSGLLACKQATTKATDADTSTLGSGDTRPLSPVERSLLDAQDFYEIAKDVYLKKTRSLGSTALSDAEERLLEKFKVNPTSTGHVTQFVETMFEILESGRYGFRLSGLPQKAQVSRAIPEGLQDRDVRNFFEMVKMYYFKRVTKRPAPEMDERERNFFERIQSRTSQREAAFDDYLLVSSDLFDVLEGLK